MRTRIYCASNGINVGDKLAAGRVVTEYDGPRYYQKTIPFDCVVVEVDRGDLYNSGFIVVEKIEDEDESRS